MLGGDIGIGKIASAVARDENLFQKPVRRFINTYADGFTAERRLFFCKQRSNNAGSAAADHRNGWQKTVVRAHGFLL